MSSKMQEMPVRGSAQLNFLLVRREVPSAAQQPAADAGGVPAVLGDLQPGPHVFAQPGQVGPLPHLQPGEFPQTAGCSL